MLYTTAMVNVYQKVTKEYVHTRLLVIVDGLLTFNIQVLQLDGEDQDEHIHQQQVHATAQETLHWDVPDAIGGCNEEVNCKSPPLNKANKSNY